MKRKVAILLLLAINLTIFGQHSIGFKLNGGLSRISNSFDPDDATLTVQSALSGQGGIFYTLQIGDKFVIGTELLFIQIEGRYKLEAELMDISGNNVGHSTLDTYNHISYLGLPVYCGIRIKKLTIHAGFQVAYALASGGRYKDQVTINGETTISENTSNKLNIDDFDFGPRLGLVFHLNERLAIDGVFYYGINNITGNSDIENFMSRKVRQLSIGLRYVLF
nr:PorT family protein [Bacteroidota bacterium]